jgi:hypothetical protein
MLFLVSARRDWEGSVARMFCKWRITVLSLASPSALLQTFPLYFFSSGKNYNDYSMMDQCRTVPNSRTCRAIVPIPSRALVAGVCLPAHCTDAQMSESASVQALLYLNFPEAALWKLPVITECDHDVHSGGGPWKPHSIAVLTLCGVVGCVMLFATAMVWAMQPQPVTATPKDGGAPRSRTGDVEIGAATMNLKSDAGLCVPLLSPSEVCESPVVSYWRFCRDDRAASRSGAPSTCMCRGGGCAGASECACGVYACMWRVDMSHGGGGGGCGCVCGGAVVVVDEGAGLGCARVWLRHVRGECDPVS